MAARRDAELTEVADGCLAYVQGRGGWGWSNSGLVETLPNASRWVQQRLDAAP